MLEPIKKSSQRPENVHVVPLEFQRHSVTVVIVASDGLWEAEEEQKRYRVSRLVSDWLNERDILRTRSSVLSESLAIELTEFARADTQDDITIAVSDYPNLVMMIL